MRFPSIAHAPFLCLLSGGLLSKQAVSAADGDDELGEAAALFSGPIEEVAAHPDFAWLESPIWSDAGNYLLFSDVKWTDEDGMTCGMIWKYNDADGVTEFLRCSGLAGPGDPPSNLADYIEAGSNGLFWGWGGDGADLLVCQHGKHRIVRIDPADVAGDGTVDPTKVKVLVDSYGGAMLNSPNDMYLDPADTGTLYFTDPPFGRQYFSEEDPIAGAYNNMTQDGIGVYTISGDPGLDAGPVEPERVVDFGNPLPDMHAPNGVAVTKSGDIVTPITDFVNPRFEVRQSTEGDEMETMRLESTYRIEGENSGFPPLNDGVTYSAELGVLFMAGPGGVYMFNSTSYDRLGFLRVDDLNSNNVLGGGYLWITANKRLLRVPLVTGDATPGSSSPTDAPTSGPTSQDTSSAPSSWPMPVPKACKTAMWGVMVALVYAL